MNISLVYITTRNIEEARQIGEKLVSERIAACVNIFDGMKSIYHWENRLCHDTETVLIAKTRTSLVDVLTRRVKELHSYSCPCIVALPVHGGSHDFLEWINRETGQQ
jgi:periplasmic divalent cation tolerance protein